MRIIAGQFGGRKLKVYPARQMRPTTDRVREAVFATLQGIVPLEDCIAIDLYAGTGSLGLEALSRGAKRAIFVEQDKRLCNALWENAETLGIADQMHVIHANLPGALERVAALLSGSSERRLFLVDPPYTAHPGAAFVAELSAAGVLARGSVLVLGTPKTLNLDFSSEYLTSCGLSLELRREKEYGDTVIHFLGFN